MTVRPRGLDGRAVSIRRRLARLTDSGNLRWSVAAALIALLALLPVISIAVLALGSSGDTWPHLIANVLPGAVRRTLILMFGVGILTLLAGTGTAWLVTMYRFPGSRYFAWLLLLPLAVPTYIIAFCYLELFDYSGSVQTGLRATFGWESAQDYWFPDIRSLSGAIFVMGAMLQNDEQPEQKEWANSVQLLFPNTNERGTHVNVSGAVIAKNAPHTENAVRLLEFLASDKGQERYAEDN